MDVLSFIIQKTQICSTELILDKLDQNFSNDLISHSLKYKSALMLFTFSLDFH